MKGEIAFAGRYARARSVGAAAVALLAVAGIGAGILLARPVVTPTAARHGMSQAAGTTSGQRYEALKERQLATLEHRASHHALRNVVAPRERYVD